MKIKIGLEEFFYLDEGQNNINGEVIIFLHGLGSRAQDFEKQIEFFKKDYRCIALDLRAHGTSTRMKPFTISQMAKDVFEFAQKLKIEKFHLVGLSLGGMIGLQFACDYSQKLKSLTVVNALPRLPRGKFALYLRMILLKIFGVKIMAKFIAKNLFPENPESDLREKFYKSFLQIDKKTYLEILNAIKCWSVENRLQKIDCKTLFIASDHDYCSTNEKEFYAKKIAAELVEIKNSHHAVPAEKPREFNEILQNWLRVLITHN